MACRFADHAAVRGEPHIEMLRRQGAGGECALEWLSALEDPRLSKVIDEIMDKPGATYTLDLLAEKCSKDLTIRGEATGYTVTADRGNEMTRYFCPVCGSRLYGSNSGRPGLISVQVGCLDDHSWFSPQVVLYSSRRHDWDITSDEIPNFEKMPPP